MTITEGSMPFGDSLLLSLVGMGFVFAILALLAVIVVIMAKIVGRKPGRSADAAPAAAPAVAVSGPAAAPAPGTAFGGSMKLIGVEDREAVLIMAIVAENSGVPLNELVFKSIRAID